MGDMFWIFQKVHFCSYLPKVRAILKKITILLYYLQVKFARPTVSRRLGFLDETPVSTSASDTVSSWPVNMGHHFHITRFVPYLQNLPVLPCNGTI